MINGKDIDEFYKRWDIELPHEESFVAFRNRLQKVVWAFLRNPLFHNPLNLYRQSLEGRFALISGLKGDGKGDIPPSIEATNTLRELVLIMQNLFWAIGDLDVAIQDKKKWEEACRLMVENVNTVLDLSPGIRLRKLEFTGKGVQLYPLGVPILDTVVDSNVLWLGRFPDVAAEYNKALRILATNENASYRQALDCLRYAMEKLLKILFKNSLPLEKQKEELLLWMKEKGVHSQIRNNFWTMLNQFTSFQNSVVKHDNQPQSDDPRTFTTTEVEYMTYLSTTLMHFVIEISRSEYDAAPK
ncbi:MAG: hypothetical protein KF749_04355 [Bacteroidetes bacterium]|nr:hypothetical protein [Bacteroidota bacterium]MCW5897609.1 hypothetical protein [Bacteroidota bacterium]